VPGKPSPERQCSGTSKQSGERCERWTTPGYNVCPSHGSKTPRGVAHHSFTHGRFSRSIPARLSESYEEALNDPRKLELADELAVIVARNREMLSSLDSGESDGLWLRLRDHKRKMDKARSNGDDDAAAAHFNALRRMIERGADDAERWAELMKNVDQQRKLAESERKRKVEDHQMATTEEVMAIMGAILAIITRHVPDTRTRRAIGYDIEALVAGDRKLEPSPEPFDGTPRL
jgi:hypothetical protein